MLYSKTDLPNISHNRALHVKRGHKLLVSELQAKLMMWRTRLEAHSGCFPARCRCRHAGTWTIMVSVYISLGFTSEKPKFPQNVLIFSQLQPRDPDKPKRSFPSFVDKLPTQFPVFGSLLDKSFPRTASTTRALTSASHRSFHTWHGEGERVSCGRFRHKHSTTASAKLRLKQNESSTQKGGF